MFEEILELTKKLVGIPSVNTTSGEHDIAVYIEEYLRDIPYFQENPEQVIIQKLKNDVLDRRNVFALIKGTKGENRDTIIIHGHMDTVGVEDFGKLEPFAFNCEELMKHLTECNLEHEILQDLSSGDYLFGRGACDMKSGVAVFMVLLKHLSEQCDKIDGNILLSVNPVEENLHTGIIEALDVLVELQKKEHLRYLFAINNDYICPLYSGDTTKYVYTGAVGKLLPCFYIQGKETHVGQCFEGFDASMAAAELVRLMNLNPAFCDGYKQEFTLPPSVLKMKDLKSHYNVQTSFSSFVYFNYFVHNKSINEIMPMLKAIAKEAMENVLQDINQKYKDFCNLSSIQYTYIEHPINVLTYEQLYQKAEQVFQGDLEHLVSVLTQSLLDLQTDKREIPLEITRKLCQISGIKEPVTVIFFAAPYCPHNTLKSEDTEEEKFIGELRTILNEFSDETHETYKILQFFPSLSDSSYLKIDDDYESIQTLKANFPEYQKIYNVPLDTIKKLNIPAINYGCYGKDAHKWTERLYMPYSFGILPKLILKTIERYFMN